MSNYDAVRAKVYDFHRPTGPGGTHPKLMDFVEEYFCGEEGGKKGETEGGGSRGAGGSVKGKETEKIWDWKRAGKVEEKVVVTDKPPYVSPLPFFFFRCLYAAVAMFSDFRNHVC